MESSIEMGWLNGGACDVPHVCKPDPGPAQNKAAEINKALKITYFAPEFVIESNQSHTNSLLDMMRASEDLRKMLK